MPQVIEIGVMGGTYNPIHDKHMVVAQAGVDQFSLHELNLVTNRKPPHKDDDILDADARFEMVDAARQGNPRLIASRIEIDRTGPSYTVDTLRLFHAHYTALYGAGNYRISLIVGEDTVPRFHTWFQDGEIFRLAPRILIAPRETVDPAREKQWRSILDQEELHHGLTIEMGVIDCPTSSVSATMIREWIRLGRSVRYLVPPAVLDLLELHGHYKNPVTPAPAAPQLVPPAATPAAPDTTPAAES